MRVPNMVTEMIEDAATKVTRQTVTTSDKPPVVRVSSRV